MNIFAGANLVNSLKSFTSDIHFTAKELTSCAIFLPLPDMNPNLILIVFLKKKIPFAKYLQNALIVKCPLVLYVAQS